MKAFIFLILALAITLNVKADYSIKPFLNYMIEKGYYTLLEQIWTYYGIDVAIDVCKGIAKTGDCDTLVRVYISKGRTRGDSLDDGPKPTLEFIIFNPDNNDLYNNEYTPQQIHDLIEKVKTKNHIN